MPLGADPFHYLATDPHCDFGPWLLPCRIQEGSEAASDCRTRAARPGGLASFQE